MSALWEQESQRRLFRSGKARFMVSGTKGRYTFGRLATDLAHAERICAAAHAEGFRHLEVYCYADGQADRYISGRGVARRSRL